MQPVAEPCTRRQWLRTSLGLGLAASATLAGSAATPLVWRERALLGLGTTLWLRAAHVDLRRFVIAEMDSGITIESSPDAGVVQWQNGSFPSFIQGFDSPHPLHTPQRARAGPLSC